MDATINFIAPPRRLVWGDVPWVINLAKQRFGEFDALSAEGWLLTQVFPNFGIYLPVRTHNAFLIAQVSAPAWNLAHLECFVILLVTDDDSVWEGVTLLRASVDWARARGAKKWGYWWDHGDAGILARRVGAKLDTPRYRIDL